MAKKYKDHSLAEYAFKICLKVPVPGGGSAAAYTGALGAALLLMVANYSLNKDKTKKANAILRTTIKGCTKILRRLLVLVDLDAQVYLKYVRAKKSNAAKKSAALRATREVPLEICRLCYQAVKLAPNLVRYGNPSLLGDIEVGAELLLASFKGALLLSRYT